MADTTNVGEIAVEIVARTNNLETGMKRAGSSVDAFSRQATSSLDKYKAAVTRVELGQKDVKQAIGTMTQALGAQGGVTGNVIKSMVEMGPAIGLAVGAFEVLNHVTKTSAENAANNVKHAADYANILKKVGEITGAVKIPGVFTSDISNVLDGINAKLEETHTQFEKASNDWLQGGAQMKILTEQADKYRNKQAELLKLQRQLEPLNVAKESFDTQMFNNKAYKKDGSEEQIKADLETTRAYVKDLVALQGKLTQGGTAYLRVQNEWRQQYLKIKDLQNDLWAIEDKKNADAQKVIQENEEKTQKHMEAQAKAAEDVAKRQREAFDNAGKAMTEAFRTPAEVLEDKLKDIIQQLEAGNITADTAERAQKAAEDAFAEPKSGKATGIGSFKQIDLANIAIPGMQGVDQQLKETRSTNRILGKIERKISSEGVPKAG